MEWGRATIGWQASRMDYKARSLSGNSDNNDIGCRYSSAYSAVTDKICTFKCGCSSLNFILAADNSSSS